MLTITPRVAPIFRVSCSPDKVTDPPLVGLIPFFVSLGPSHTMKHSIYSTVSYIISYPVFVKMDVKHRASGGACPLLVAGALWPCWSVPQA